MTYVAETFLKIHKHNQMELIDSGIHKKALALCVELGDNESDLADAWSAITVSKKRLAVAVIREEMDGLSGPLIYVDDVEHDSILSDAAFTGEWTSVFAVADDEYRAIKPFTDQDVDVCARLYTKSIDELPHHIIGRITLGV